MVTSGNAGRTPGREYLPAGDAELDRRFVFQGRPPELVARAAADAALRRALTATDAWLRLDARSASSHVAELVTDVEQLRAMAEQAAEAADFVERAVAAGLLCGPPPPAGAGEPLDATVRVRLPRWVLPVALGLAVVVLLACLGLGLLAAVSHL